MYANFVNSNLNDPLSWFKLQSDSMNSDVKTIESFDNKIFCRFSHRVQLF